MRAAADLIEVNAALTVAQTTIKNSADQGIYNRAGTLSLQSTAVYSNTVGIVSTGNASIENSTVSGNPLGGIDVNDGSLLVSSSTITGNGGFGLKIGRGKTAVLQNTILAGNTAAAKPDCSGPLQSNGYNLIGSTQGCTFTPAAGDLTNLNPGVGPRQDNGGPTFTHALLPGSPAIGAGNPAGCSGSSGP